MGQSCGRWRREFGQLATADIDPFPCEFLYLRFSLSISPFSLDRIEIFVSHDGPPPPFLRKGDVRFTSGAADKRRQRDLLPSPMNNYRDICARLTSRGRRNSTSKAKLAIGSATYGNKPLRDVRKRSLLTFLWMFHGESEAEFITNRVS